MTTNVVEQASVSIEEILCTGILALPELLSPAVYMAQFCDKCTGMTVQEFLSLGFPMDIIDVTRNYKQSTTDAVIRKNKTIISTVSKGIPVLPLVKKTTRRLL